jgi:hypothetical protein
LTKQSRDYCAAIDVSHRFRGRFAHYAARVAPKPSRPSTIATPLSKFRVARAIAASPKQAKARPQRPGFCFRKQRRVFRKKYDQNTRELFSGQRPG